MILTIDNMASEVDFSSISQRLGVKEEVISQLADSLPYEDSFQFITSAENADHFWDLVDLLPRNVSMPLHSVEAEIAVTNRDFPESFVSPIFQSFYISNCVSQGTEPTTVNSRAVSQVFVGQMKDLLSDNKNWSFDENESVAYWKKNKDNGFSLENLCNMCNSFVSEGLPWLFFNDSQLRAAYNQLYIFLFSVDKKYIYRVKMIKNKLMNMQYFSTDQIKKENKDISEKFQIFQDGETSQEHLIKFNVDSELMKEINDLFHRALELIQNTQIPPEIPPIDEWTRTRSEALVNQMLLPLQNRSAFSLTPQIFQARIGMNSDNAFEPLSLSELLFSDPNGDAATMPFYNCHAELPSQSYMPYCKSVLRRFIARRLLKNGFESSSEPCLDIISDVLSNELKKIAQLTGRISRGADVNDVDVLYRALELCGYDVGSLQE